MFYDVPVDEPIYPIRTAAKLLNSSVHTLRMYERVGLIIPFKKDSGQRLYSEKDLERLRCIRESINKDKISIEGILRIFALIPCWAIIKCSEENRNNCAALQNSMKPCWTLKHKSDACANLDCRTCKVYNEFGNCHSIKDKLIQLTLGEK